MSRTANLKVGSPAQLLLERADGSCCAVHPLWLRERCKDAASMDLMKKMMNIIKVFYLLVFHQFIIVQ